ncbi:hypothetical protein [Winogradskyella sp.]|uniref:hypothetical protein n=1 Tax=Winogradskyella sp. TaxID=1883156 RepID=UPI003BAABD7E
MATKLTLSGIVIDKGTNERISNAVVSLKTPNSTLLEYTDDDGRFKFKDVEEPDLGQDELKYNISLKACSEHGTQYKPVPLIVPIDKGQDKHYAEIKLVDRGPISSVSGIVFLIVLIITLILAGFAYYEFHIANDETPKEIDSKLIHTLVDNFESQVTSDSLAISGLQLKDGLIDTTDMPLLRFKLQQLQEATNEVFKVAATDSSYQALVQGNMEALENALSRQSREDVIKSLSKIKNLILDVPNLTASWFWESKPLIYVEILFWAFFATLLRLIGNTSYYISRNRFFRDSISHKAALLFTIPVIAWIITLVVSFFEITVSIGGTNINIDFSNIYVVIIVAFLIGLAPWRSWDFIRDLADKLFDGLKKWLGLKNTPTNEA